MAIKVTVGSSPIDIPVEEEPKKPQASMQMNARKTLDGNLAIYDHLDIDIVVMPQQNKVLALAKKDMSDEVYESQSRLFDFLVKKGVVLPESVRGGNVYGSLEGLYPPSLQNGKDHSQVAVFTIGKFIEEEKPYYMWNQAHDDMLEDWWVDPEPDDTTDLGDVSHEETKGSLPKGQERIHGYRVYESKE